MLWETTLVRFEKRVYTNELSPPCRKRASRQTSSEFPACGPAHASSVLLQITGNLSFISVEGHYFYATCFICVMSTTVMNSSRLLAHSSRSTAPGNLLARNRHRCSRAPASIGSRTTSMHKGVLSGLVFPVSASPSRKIIASVNSIVFYRCASTRNGLVSFCPQNITRNSILLLAPKPRLA